MGAHRLGSPCTRLCHAGSSSNHESSNFARAGRARAAPRVILNTQGRSQDPWGDPGEKVRVLFANRFYLNQHLTVRYSAHTVSTYALRNERPPSCSVDGKLEAPTPQSLCWDASDSSAKARRWTPAAVCAARLAQRGRIASLQHRCSIAAGRWRRLAALVGPTHETRRTQRSLLALQKRRERHGCIALTAPFRR